MRSAECRKYWDEMVDLAEGKPQPAAQSHADSCADCAKRLEDLKTIIRLAAIPAHEAPAETREKANRIFAPARPVLVAALSAQAAGARAVASDSMQFQREIDGISIRLMIKAEGAGWHVLGRLEGSTAPELSHLDHAIPVTNGAFEFRTNSLQEDLWLDDDSRLIRIPLRSEE